MSQSADPDTAHTRESGMYLCVALSIGDRDLVALFERLEPAGSSSSLFERELGRKVRASAWILSLGSLFASSNVLDPCLKAPKSDVVSRYSREARRLVKGDELTQNFLQVDPRSDSLDDFCARVEVIDDSVDASNRVLVNQICLVDQDDVGELDLIDEKIGDVSGRGGRSVV